LVACPLCILGVPEEEHSPERFASITDEERKVIAAYNKLHPGVILTPEQERRRQRERARARAGEEGIGF
jgi:hypothetical protein